MLADSLVLLGFTCEIWERLRGGSNAEPWFSNIMALHHGNDWR